VRLLDHQFDPWRWVRAYGVAAILTAPLYGVTHRWVGIPGGPNELGLVAGVLLLLAVDRRSWRYGAIAVLGLVGAQSITAVGATAVALFILKRPLPNTRRLRRAFSPTIAAFAVPVLLF